MELIMIFFFIFFCEIFEKKYHERFTRVNFNESFIHIELASKIAKL